MEANKIFLNIYYYNIIIKFTTLYMNSMIKKILNGIKFHLLIIKIR